MCERKWSRKLVRNLKHYLDSLAHFLLLKPILNGDGVSDGVEVAMGSNPLDAASTPVLDDLDEALAQVNTAQIGYLCYLCGLPFAYDSSASYAQRISQLREMLEALLGSFLDLEVNTGGMLAERPVVVVWKLVSVLTSIGSDSDDWLEGLATTEQVEEIVAVLEKLTRLVSIGEQQPGHEYQPMAYHDGAVQVGNSWDLGTGLPKRWPTNQPIQTCLLLDTKVAIPMVGSGTVDDWILVNNSARFPVTGSIYTQHVADISTVWNPDGTNTLALWDCGDCAGTNNYAFLSPFSLIHVLDVPVLKVDFVDVHSSDTDTHKIPAVFGATHDDHFVCVKDTGDVILNATVSPNDPAVFDQLVWEADGATITYPAVGTDKRTAKLSSSSSARVPVRIKVGGSTCWEGVAWIVWASGSSNNRPLSFIVGTSGSNIAADWDFAWNITPAQIITDTDRPDLSGANTASPPNGSKRHVISNNPLSGGADKKWDASRQGQFKVINPHLYTKAQLPSVPGIYYDNQPVGLDLPDVYPSNPAEGNDDSHPGDEDNDPYTSPAQGSLTAVDTPSAPMKTSTGALHDTYEERYHFHEFARIELGGVWYRMSDNLLWRVHYKYKKANTQITTGANGVCNTTASGDDVQVITLNSGKAGTTSITAGTNGTIDTTPAGDDQLVAGAITTGANGICNTTATGDDVQVIPVGAGEPNAICITSGVNTKLDTTPGGDDVGATVRWVDNGSDQAADNNGF